MKIIIVCLLLFSSSVFAVPITWLSNPVNLYNKSLSIEDFNKLPLYSKIVGYTLTVPGVNIHISGLNNLQLRTQLLGFEQGSLLTQRPIGDIFPNAFHGSGMVNIYKLNDHIGIAYTVTIRSLDSSYTHNATSLFTNLAKSFAKILTGQEGGIHFKIIKIANISNLFKTVSYKKTTSGIINLIGQNSTITSPVATLNIDVDLIKTSCALTLNTNNIDYGNVTDSALKSGIVNQSLKISSTCSNGGVNNVDVQLLNASNGIIYSSDNAIGFRVYDNDDNLLINPVSIKSETANYNIKIVAFPNKLNDIYGSHHSSLNMMFTYK